VALVVLGVAGWAESDQVLEGVIGPVGLTRLDVGDLKRNSLAAWNCASVACLDEDLAVEVSRERGTAHSRIGAR